jgi:catalase
VKRSAPLSLRARPGSVGIRSRKIALLVADGVVGEPIARLQAALLEAGAIPRIVAPRLGKVTAIDGDALDADASLENSPSVLFDAVVLPDGERAVKQLSLNGQALEFVQLQYRHCKTLLALGASAALLEAAGAFDTLPEGGEDPGVIKGPVGELDGLLRSFVDAVGLHRHDVRDRDPPLV